MNTQIFASLVALLSAIVLSACASSARNKAPPMYDLVIKDNVEQRRFELMLVSTDERSICFEVEKWPNKHGQVSGGSWRAILISGEQKFSAPDTNFGFCPGGCGIIVVSPGETLRGFIPYSEFGDPVQIAQLQDRRLEYLIVPRICTLSERTSTRK